MIELFFEIHAVRENVCHSRRGEQAEFHGFDGGMAASAISLEQTEDIERLRNGMQIHRFCKITSYFCSLDTEKSSRNLRQ